MLVDDQIKIIGEFNDDVSCMADEITELRKKLNELNDELEKAKFALNDR